MKLNGINFTPSPKNILHKVLLALILGAFFWGSVFFATNLKRGIIPDEPAHFKLSTYFSTTLGIPPDVPETYSMGYIGHKPFLYYWINGRVLSVLERTFGDIGDWRKLVSLRLVSVLYAFLSVLFTYLLAKEVIKNRWWQLLVVFLLTNTLMFVFLAGGVNYDNLANLCAFAGIYYLIRVFNGKHFYRNSLGWLICISAGILVKVTILPLALIMGLVWLFYIRQHYKQIDFQVIINWKMMSFLVVFSILIFLNLTIYGVNITKYKALFPACIDILTEDQCNLSPFVARAKQLNVREKLTIQDVIENGNLDPIEYAPKYWYGSMLQRIYGIMGHRSYFPDLIITFYYLFFLWTLFITVRYWKKPSFALGSLYIIFTFYALVLLWVNYNSELTTGFKHVAIQGRYIFPVIGVLYTLVVYYMTQIPNPLIRRISAIFTITLFFVGGPVFVLYNADTLLANWFFVR